MTIDTVIVGPFEVNCYLVFDSSTRKGAIIDPGGDEELILSRIKNHSMLPEAILLTHGHGDHIAALPEIKKRLNVPHYIGRGDEPLLESPSANVSALYGYPITCPPADFAVSDGDTLNLGGINFSVLATPGHTPGGVCYMSGRFLFCGDTLFNYSVGRTDLPGGNYEQLISSIEKNILTLPDDIICYPGHGPATTVGEERRNNPFLTGRRYV